MPMGKGKYPDLHAAIDKLHPGEPCFLLRAQDLLAPATVKVYSEMLAERGQFKGADDVRMFVETMIAWQTINPDKTKLPD